jgi:hypothetical protein
MAIHIILHFERGFMICPSVGYLFRNSPTIEVWGVISVPATIPGLTGLFHKDRHKIG